MMIQTEKQKGYKKISVIELLFKFYNKSETMLYILDLPSENTLHTWINYFLYGFVFLITLQRLQ